MVGRRATSWSARATLVAIAWTLVATALALQGYLTARYAGHSQPWWPAFLYSLAIASIWALLTPAMLIAVRRIGRSDLPVGVRAALLGLGLVFSALLHVALFSLLFWPAYGAGQHATLLAMGLHMAVRNVGLNALFYVALVAIGLRTLPAVPPAPPLSVIRTRRKGVVRHVPVPAILWLRSAGNYAEAITSEGPVLLDDPLSKLARQLPSGVFARVHRTALVRLDAIVEVRSRGRGDAELLLSNGDVVRLSRRFRSALEAYAPKA